MKKIIFISFCLLSASKCILAKESVHIDFSKYQSVYLTYWDYLPDSNFTTENILSSAENWQKISLSLLENYPDGTHWLKKDINISDQYKIDDNLALSFFNFPVAYEIYWDGILLNSNGILGRDKQSEVAGKVRYDLKIPFNLITPGEHTILIHISNFHGSNQLFGAWIQLGYLSVFETFSRNETTEQAVYIGLYFTAALFCISLFIGGWKHTSFLFFSGYTFFYFLIALWIFLIEGKVINIITYRIFEPFFHQGHVVANSLLTFFALSFFESKKKWIHIFPLLAIVLLIKVVFPGSDNQTTQNLIYLLLLAYALFIILLNFKNKIAGIYFLLTAFLLYIIFSGYTFAALVYLLPLPYYFFVNLGVNVIFVSLIIISISRKIQERNKKYNEALLLSHRLESELLKKSIQPHFIMNTLLSLKSWLLKDSDTAEKMIDALANQFSIINKVATEKEIPIGEEIELCKSHLELMGYRFNAQYKLITNGNFNGQCIPPLIFHTLIENGITHAYLPKESGTFTLSCDKKNGLTEYTLCNDGSQIKSFSENSNNVIGEGLGIKYVKTRLEENYPEQWSIEYGMKNGLWEVRLSIKTRD
ncbi:MAG: histidine kinase [bacterium]